MNILQWEQTPLSAASRAECIKNRNSYDSQQFVKEVIARMPQEMRVASSDGVYEDAPKDSSEFVEGLDVDELEHEEQ